MKFTRHRLQDDVRPLSGGHLNELPPLLADLYVRWERRLAQLAARRFVREAAADTLNLAEAALSPTLEAPNVNALNRTFTPAWCDERVILLWPFTEANAANLGILIANLCAPGSKTVTPRLLGSNNGRICGQLTNTEFGAPDFDEITLGKSVESHGEAPHGKPPLLWIGGGRSVVDLR